MFCGLGGLSESFLPPFSPLFPHYVPEGEINMMARGKIIEWIHELYQGIEKAETIRDSSSEEVTKNIQDKIIRDNYIKIKVLDKILNG